MVACVFLLEVAGVGLDVRLGTGGVSVFGSGSVGGVSVVYCREASKRGI
jgi:hypothetical protein